MANRAYLLVVDRADTIWSKNPAREILAEGINEIPVFWASLFTARDRRMDLYKVDGSPRRVPNYCARTSVAKRRVRARSERVVKLLDQRARKLWSQWVEVVCEQKSAFIKTNAAEVWNLRPADYDGYWTTLLTAFAEPSPDTLKAALMANGLRYARRSISWDDVEETVCKLTGAEHIRDLPWMDVDELGSRAAEQAPAGAAASGPSFLDRIMMFKEATGMSYEVATMLLVVLGDAALPSGSKTKAIKPEQLLQRILRRYRDYYEMSDDERSASLAEKKINGPSDLWRAIEGLRKAGYDVALIPDGEAALTAAPSNRTLFRGIRK